MHQLLLICLHQLLPQSMLVSLIQSQSTLLSGHSAMLQTLQRQLQLWDKQQLQLRQQLQQQQQDKEDVIGQLQHQLIQVQEEVQGNSRGQLHLDLCRAHMSAAAGPTAGSEPPSPNQPGMQCRHRHSQPHRPHWASPQTSLQPKSLPKCLLLQWTHFSSAKGPAKYRWHRRQRQVKQRLAHACWHPMQVSATELSSMQHQVQGICKHKKPLQGHQCQT